MKLSMLAIIVTTLVGCQTTRDYIMAWRCVDEDIYKEGACKFRAAFVSPMDCINFLSLVRNEEKDYTICAMDPVK